jgi:transposase-like protein
LFTPVNCPNSSCARHRDPVPGFFIRKGFYRSAAKPGPIPRFRCRTCGRSWSLQTFRADYRDHKPQLNSVLFKLLVSGLGLRQAARMLPLTRKSTHLKFCKIARELQAAHNNLLGEFPTGSWFQMDELGAFEQDRHSGPLSLPIVIEASSFFIVAAETAPIRPSGKKTKAQRERIARHEREHGRRRDRSREATRRVLQVVEKHTRKMEKVRLRTDRKAMYVPVAASVFGAERLVHERVSGKLPRTTFNPIFRINLTDAMARDNNGRLRRRSWLHSKKAKYLDLQLALFMAYRNYVRLRTNEDDRTPAQVLGLIERRLTCEELLGWSQLMGEQSVAVTCSPSRAITVGEWRRLRGLAS